MIQVSERYLVLGQKTFFKEVAIPAGKVIEKAAKEYPCTLDVDSQIIHPPTAFLSGLDALIGIVVFLGGWAGTKFFDEVYDAWLGPAIKRYLKPYVEKTGPEKKYSLAVLARKKNVESSVLICCVGASIEEIESSEVHIPSVLGIAERYLDSSNDSFVYLFVIDSGKVNLEPEVYESHGSAMDGLNRKYPAKLPSHIVKSNG